MNEYTYGSHDADELMTDPPPRLTARGLEMLVEIWIAAGRPTKPIAEGDDDGTHDVPFAAIENLASHHRSDVERRSAAQIRRRLIEGGYLHIREKQSLEDEIYGRDYTITDLGLSATAFDALIAAGHLSGR
jgi:hypothetical protein